MIGANGKCASYHIDSALFRDSLLSHGLFGDSLFSISAPVQCSKNSITWFETRYIVANFYNFPSALSPRRKRKWGFPLIFSFDN